jgi:hypothetical protein
MVRSVKCLMGFHQWPGRWTRRGPGKARFRGSYYGAYEACSRCGKERLCEWEYGTPTDNSKDR